MTDEPQPVPPADTARRLNRAFGPVVAGMILDVVDLATFGPIGFFLGIPVGLAAGYWLGSCLGLERKHFRSANIACGWPWRRRSIAPCPVRSSFPWARWWARARGFGSGNQERDP
jgi:hypothetical protein